MKKGDEVDFPSEADEKSVGRKPQRTSRAALAMRIRGASYVEIAEFLDYGSPAVAKAAVENLMASTVDENTDIKALRALATARLEAGMKAHANLALNEYVSMPDPNDPDGKRRIRVKNEEQLGHSMMYFRYVDRWAKLKGLDAPQVMALVTPDSVAFEQVVSEIAALSRKGDSEEADIFEEGPDGTYQRAGEPDAAEEEPDADQS